MKKKHIPIRMCTGCNKMKNKDELIRIVKTTDFDNTSCSLLIDKSLKRSGKGAYLCKNLDCLKNVKKTKRLERTFSCKIPLSFYSDIEEVILANEQ